MLDRLHLGDCGNGALEIIEADAALGGELDSEKDGDAESQFFVIEIKALTSYRAALVQLADAPPCGGLRQAEAAADGARRQRGIPGQKPQDAAVGGVERHHSGSPSSDLIRATCISASISAICGRVRMALR